MPLLRDQGKGRTRLAERLALLRPFAVPALPDTADDALRVRTHRKGSRLRGRTAYRRRITSIAPCGF
jgi:hypothetical protein